MFGHFREEAIPKGRTVDVGNLYSPRYRKTKSKSNPLWDLETYNMNDVVTTNLLCNSIGTAQTLDSLSLQGIGSTTFRSTNGTTMGNTKTYEDFNKFLEPAEISKVGSRIPLGQVEDRPQATYGKLDKLSRNK